MTLHKLAWGGVVLSLLVSGFCWGALLVTKDSGWFTPAFIWTVNVLAFGCSVYLGWDEE